MGKSVYELVTDRIIAELKKALSPGKSPGLVYSPVQSPAQLASPTAC